MLPSLRSKKRSNTFFVFEIAIDTCAWDSITMELSNTWRISIFLLLDHFTSWWFAHFNLIRPIRITKLKLVPRIWNVSKKSKPLDKKVIFDRNTIADLLVLDMLDFLWWKWAKKYVPYHTVMFKRKSIKVEMENRNWFEQTNNFMFAMPSYHTLSNFLWVKRIPVYFPIIFTKRNIFLNIDF